MPRSGGAVLDVVGRQQHPGLCPPGASNTAPLPAGTANEVCRLRQMPPLEHSHAPWRATPSPSCGSHCPQTWATICRLAGKARAVSTPPRPSSHDPRPGENSLLTPGSEHPRLHPHGTPHPAPALRARPPHTPALGPSAHPFLGDLQQFISSPCAAVPPTATRGQE